MASRLAPQSEGVVPVVGGTLIDEAGKRAGLILVDGNPLKSISELRSVRAVFTSGRQCDSRIMEQRRFPVMRRPSCLSARRR